MSENNTVDIDISEFYESMEDKSYDDSVWVPGNNENSENNDTSVWHPSDEENSNPVNSEESAPEDNGKHGKYKVNPNMFVYVKMHFTSLEKNAEYISIALCDKEGNSFYAEFNDFSLSNVSSWTFEHVCKKLVNPTTNLQGNHWQMRGNRKDISMNLLIWLNDLHERTGAGIQFVGDCCHYNMVFLVDLLWKYATRIPEWISPVMVDINNDLSNLVLSMYDNKDTEDGTEIEFNPYYHAFNLDRESYASQLKDAPEGSENNAMYDAYVIRAIHQSIWDIK